MPSRPRKLNKFNIPKIKFNYSDELEEPDLNIHIKNKTCPLDVNKFNIKMGGGGSKQRKIIIVGLDNAGKTTLINSLKASKVIHSLFNYMIGS